ncbi:MAG: FAD-linked oxidase C-terminal domain-containing protein, partial [Ferrovibrionaceae bacterium]
IHVVVLFPHERFATPEAFEEASDIVDVIIDDVAMELGGSITAEHGVGVTYRKRLARTKNPVELGMMRQIKTLLDPNNMMNPGKLFLPGTAG